MTTVEVTQEDIASGSPRNCWRCPVALSVRRHMKSMGVDVSIGRSTVRFHNYPARVVTMPMPDEISDRIFEFDEGRQMLPFSFELDIPAAFLR